METDTRNRYSPVLKTVPILFLVLLCLPGCDTGYDGPIDTHARDFYIDFKNTLFNAPDETEPELRGLGIDSVRITVTTVNEAEEQTAYTGTITADSVDTEIGFTYSQIPVPIEGQIVSLTADASDGSGAVKHTAVLTAESGEWDYHGWNVFSNIDKAKIDFAVDQKTPSASLFRLVVCPRGGDSPIVRVDSGVQTEEGNTDRWDEIETKQLALEIEFAEYPADVTFNVYTAVAEENLIIKYNEAVTFDAFYEPNPWTDSWTYSEITAAGKEIGGKLYTLHQYNTTEYSAVVPMELENDEEEKQAIIIDLSASEDEELTEKYLLVGIIMYYSGLAAPLDVLCLDIN